MCIRDSSNALEALQESSGGKLNIRGFVRSGSEDAAGGLLRNADAAHPFLVIRFQDTGPGISPEHIGRLFEPFFTTKPAGTGLGLAITYGIVDTHGGVIDVASKAGHGTTFVLNVPVTQEDEVLDS